MALAEENLFEHLAFQGRKHVRKSMPASQPEVLSDVQSEPEDPEVCVEDCLETRALSDAQSEPEDPKLCVEDRVETLALSDAPEESESPVNLEAWEKYWAGQGEGLLWQSWLEKHPESDGSPAVGPWDCPETREEWELHTSQTYLYYWEQFCYWAAQGWTAEGDSCSAVPSASEPPLDGEQLAAEAEAAIEGLEPLGQDTGDTCSSGLEQGDLGMGDVTQLVGGLSLQVGQTGGDVRQGRMPSGDECAKDRGDDKSQSVSSSGGPEATGEYRCGVLHKSISERKIQAALFGRWLVLTFSKIPFDSIVI